MLVDIEVKAEMLVVVHRGDGSCTVSVGAKDFEKAYENYQRVGAAQAQAFATAAVERDRETA